MKYIFKPTGEECTAEQVTADGETHGAGNITMTLSPGSWKVWTPSGTPWGYAPSDEKFKENFEPVVEKKKKTQSED